MFRFINRSLAQKVTSSHLRAAATGAGSTAGHLPRVSSVALTGVEKRAFAQGHERYTASMGGHYYDENAVLDENINCMVLHPVGWPNQGPHVELYLAEEAIGLAKSLGWSVTKGPLWYQLMEEDENYISEATTDAFSSDEEDEFRYLSEDHAPLSPQERERMKEEQLEARQNRLNLMKAYEDGGAPDIGGGEMKQFNLKRNYQKFRRQSIRNGDYVYGPDLQGVYLDGGVILDLENDEQVHQEEEWTNVELRECVAKSSLVRTRKISSTTFFSKGKMNDLGAYIKENEAINVVFINSTMTPTQVKKLEKRWNDMLLGREERVREYNLKSAQKENQLSPTEGETTSALSDYGGYTVAPHRRVRVIDRFSIILQIFALRARTEMAQLQIELAWLRYAKTLLSRGNSPSFGVIKGLFGGNLMRQEVVEVEIKSGKGGAQGAIGGAGETQLQMEQFNLKVRMAKINRDLKDLEAKKKHQQLKRDNAHNSLPLVALIGYTNAGKTAMTNLMTGAELESRNMLFQTLNTAQRGFLLPNGQKARLLDTVGFISDLPHHLVESFKATLEEIHHADVLVHVRDISHPHTDHQRETVLSVLKDIGVRDETLAEKYIEVWNKSDLLEDKEQFELDYLDVLYPEKEKLDEGHLPPVLMSCEKQENVEQLMETISDLSMMSMGKRYMTIKYPGSEHYKRLKWLNVHASMNPDQEFDYDEEGNIILRVLLDDVIYQRYLKEFEPEIFEAARDKTKKGMQAPKGW